MTVRSFLVWTHYYRKKLHISFAFMQVYSMKMVYLFNFLHTMRFLSISKTIIRSVIISVLVLYFGCITLLNIPIVQRGLSNVVTDELEKLLQTEVEIGNIDLGLLNRIIIQDVKVLDRDGNRMIKIARFSAKFDIGALLDGQIRIQSVQLFGANLHLSKKNPEDRKSVV